MKIKRLLLTSLLILAAGAAAAFAQTVPVSTDVAPIVTPAAADAGGGSMAMILSVALAAVTSLIAIWQNKQASTAKKVVSTLVLGVERATQLPQVQHAEQAIKAKIRQQAEELGVQPILHEIVKDLT